MRTPRRALTATAIIAVAAATGSLVGAGSADAAKPARVPVVTVHLNKAVKLSSGSSLHAGRIKFRVLTYKGTHELQIARLRSGYTAAQAFADVNKSFTGDVAAIRRVDANVSFRGGTQTKPARPGMVGLSLSAGQYLFIDTDTNSYTTITVHGTAPARAGIPHSGDIAMYTYGFGTMPRSLPASGAVTVRNQSDQPHFVSMLHVRSSTTAAQVRKYFASGAQGNPSWVLKANADSAILSPNRSEVWSYDLPAGRYVVACFWPDDDTGMPHAFMGMWSLLTLH